jgi:hypothetical protein
MASFVYSLAIQVLCAKGVPGNRLRDDARRNPPSANAIRHWMPTENILALLTQERDKLNRAIEALQGVRGRPGRRPAYEVGES